MTDPGSLIVLQHSSGWPWLACRGWRWEDIPTRFADVKIRSRWSLEPALFESDPTANPTASDLYAPILGLMPVFPGFALNTAFYGAVAFTSWSAPGLIRRRPRRARGQCLACGYDLNDAPTSTCPECGV